MNGNAIRPAPQKPPEEWKVLPLDETVQISSLGRVRRNGKIRKKTKPDKDGYLRITIKGKSYRLHRFVAELFVENPNPDEYTVVDHINNKHDDARAENLRWVTPQMNAQFAADMGLQNRIKNDDSVFICWNIESKDGYIFNTAAECAKKFKVNPKVIFNVISGKAKSVKGHKVIKINLNKKERKKLL